MNGAKAILVDLDGTLYRQTPVRLAMALELILTHRGWVAWPTLSAFRREHEALRLLDRDVPDPFAFQLHQTALKLEQHVADVRATVDEWMFQRSLRWVRLFRRHALIQRIKEFRNGGGRTALVSDYPASAKLKALNAEKIFDAVVAPGGVDAPCRIKPSPEGYLLAARRLGVSPSDCLVVGDRVDADGQAAQNAGMRFRRVQGMWDSKKWLLL